MLRSFKKQAKNAANLTNEEVAKNIIECINGNRVYQSWDQTLELYRGLLNETTAQDLHAAFTAMWRTDNRFVSVTGNALIEEQAEETLAALYHEGGKTSGAAPGLDRQDRIPLSADPPPNRAASSPDSKQRCPGPLWRCMRRPLPTAC